MNENITGIEKSQTAKTKACYIDIKKIQIERLCSMSGL